jgi:hypothetical protein
MGDVAAIEAELRAIDGDEKLSSDARANRKAERRAAAFVDAVAHLLPVDIRWTREGGEAVHVHVVSASLSVRAVRIDCVYRVDGARQAPRRLIIVNPPLLTRSHRGEIVVPGLPGHYSAAGMDVLRAVVMGAFR